MATTQQQQQYDVLWTTTESNPLLPVSPVPTINKSLITNAKQIIKAINEVFKNNQGTQSSLDSFIKNFNIFATLVGDTYADSTLSPKLDAIGDNIILALDSLSAAIKELGKSIADKADTSTTNEISDAIAKINESIKNINSAIESGAIGAGGGTMAQEIVDLGSCNIPMSSTSLYKCMAYIDIPSDVIPKINFNKPLRLQIYKSYTGGYVKNFDTLIFDNGINLGNDLFNVGYTQDKTSIAILNIKYSITNAKVNLVIE